MIDGRPTAVKTRPGPEAGVALSAELELLGSLDVPGVVRPAVEALSDEPALLLEGAGTSTLATNPPAPGHVRPIGRRLLATLGSMHDAGVVHGAIEPAHVLWAPGSDPVLCGFGSARRSGDGETDIEALGAMLAALLPEDDPLRAELARADGDRGRLAAALTDPAESTSGPRLQTQRRPAQDADTRRHLLLAAGAGVAAAALLAGAILALWPFGGGDASDRTSAPTGAAIETGDTEPSPSTAPAPPAPTTTDDPLVWPEPPTDSAPADCTGRSGSLGAADVDGDGCAEPIDRDGAVVSAGDRRWSVGDVDDHLALGDWWCTGTPTLALVTAATGDVHVFTTWPVAAPDRVTATTTVGPAAGVRVAAADGCDVLVVELADGTMREVAP